MDINKGSLLGNIGREQTGFSETLELFIAGSGYCMGVLTVRGGTEERDLIGCHWLCF